MKWETTSTASPREVAQRFAMSITDDWTQGGIRHRVAVVAFHEEPGPDNGPVRALFRLSIDAHQWYELEGVPPGQWTVTSKARRPRRIIAIPVDQCYHDGTRDLYHTRARLLVAGVNDFPGFSLGIIRAGQSGRQVYQGPLVPGPWAFASGHATVIDNHGGSRGDVDREHAEGRVYTAEPGDVLEIDGCHFLIRPADNHGHLSLTLVPAPATVG